MKLSFLIGVIIFGLAAAVQSKALDSAVSDDNGLPLAINLEDALKMYLLGIRNVMPCGFAPFGIPVMAPFTEQHVPFNFSLVNMKISGSLSNLVIKGFNNWRLLESPYQTDSKRITFDIIFPEIHILADSSWQASGYLAGLSSNYAGENVLDVVLNDLRYVSDFELGSSSVNPNGLEITDFHLDFSLGSIVWRDWNSLLDSSSDNDNNNWLRELFSISAQQFQGQLGGMYKAFVLPMINEALENVNMNDLIGGLIYSAQQLNSVSCNVNSIN